MELQTIITNFESKDLIDARKLYNFLQYAPQHFSRWAKKNIESNDFFFENIDWFKTEFLDLSDIQNIESKNTLPTKGEQNSENSKNLFPKEEQNSENQKTLDIEGEEGEQNLKHNTIRKDYYLSYEMAYHLSLQCNTKVGHDLRQSIIKEKKQRIENQKRVADISNEKEKVSFEIENLKKVRLQTNKRLKYLTEKEKELNKEQHFLITGNAPKQIDLFTN